MRPGEAVKGRLLLKSGWHFDKMDVFRDEPA